MKIQMTNQRYQLNYRAHTLMLWAFLFIVLLLTLCIRTIAAAQNAPVNDDNLPTEILRQLKQKSVKLNFPLSVERCYKGTSNQPLWVVKEPEVQHTWAAMLMMDCVLQFGLNQTDFHSKNLLYSTLHDILEQPKKVNLNEQARFDILLTDALITFINYLHYGKYNPFVPKNKLDSGTATLFDAVGLLHKALRAENFMETIVSAQPKNEVYQALQNHLHLIAGVQLGDCYEFPEAKVRKIALNLERLRWANMESDNVIQVNIPSYKLTFYHRGKQDTMRVIVGKPANPTPTLKSTIKYFTVAPQWLVPKRIFTRELLPKAIKDSNYLSAHLYTIYKDKQPLTNLNSNLLMQINRNPGHYHAIQSSGCDNALGQIVFRFDNLYEIFLHDSPEKGLFYQDKRALSHGCIRVQNAKKLAELILTNDEQKLAGLRKALKQNNTKDFFLKDPLPIVITYLTCEINDGQLVVHDDIYGLDPALDQLLYRKNDPSLQTIAN